jgi:hypothetical protein
MIRTVVEAENGRENKENLVDKALSTAIAAKVKLSLKLGMESPRGGARTPRDS